MSLNESCSLSSYIEIDDTPPKPDRIRLICMGKGILGPDNANIESCDLPIFLTHATPINVSVKPVIVEDTRRYFNVEDCSFQ